MENKNFVVKIEEKDFRNGCYQFRARIVEEEDDRTVYPHTCTYREKFSSKINELKENEPGLGPLNECNWCNGIDSCFEAANVREAKIILKNLHTLAKWLEKERRRKIKLLSYIYVEIDEEEED